MPARRLTGSVFHVVGVGDDELRPLLDHAVHQLRDRHPLSIRRVDFIDVDHLGPRNLFFHVPSGLVVRLAPAVVVIRADEDHAEHERLRGGRFGRGGRFRRGRFGRGRLGGGRGLGGGGATSCQQQAGQDDQR